MGPEARPCRSRRPAGPARRPAPPARFPLSLATLTLALAVLALPPASALAKDELPRRRLPPEFEYVDAATEEAAAEELPKLLQKYATPKSCAALLDVLRKKRPYPSKIPDRITLDFACEDGKTRQFTWILPSKYAKGKPVGVLFFLHGAVRQGPPGGGANEAGMFAPAVKPLNLVMVGPSTYEGVEWGSPACRGLVHHALDVLKQHVNVDEDRVYMAGDSDGGRGAFNLAETEATFLAAVVPVIGSPGGVTRFANFRNLPFFAINGETDTIFDIAHVREMVDGMKEAGIELEWKLIQGQGHDPRFFLTYDEEVCEFLKKHVRDPFPKKVHWQVDPSRKDHGGGFPGDTFRWVRIEEAGSSTTSGTFTGPEGRLLAGGLPRIEASYEGNTVDLQTRGVTKVTVLVSDQMLDLSKEVEIRTNGHLSFRGMVEPDAKVILEEARRFKDRRLVFVNRVTVDVDVDVDVDATRPDEPPPDAPPGDGAAPGGGG